ncbi:flagellar basal body-associated protein FliL [Anaerohalosphaera lusitana]|uniref:Flagellar protein FliL n=1 Tax=Anaerohalosphaera lusitana TaxID=1936003 RepID=A0A1U9NH54_9BACT|nr:flagellar basal body-associated FliL family protein [Anaerohalosphaera lusitana]AQT66930.1 flagellar basal body-associated protein FliL [Anaerohalosphaera lusitana]
MADEEKKKKDTKEKKRPCLLGHIITAVISLTFAAGGYFVSGLFADTKPQGEQAAEEKKEDPSAEINALLAESTEGSKPWTYELEPVVANLNEPGATRFVRATLIMEISGDMAQEKGKEFLGLKTPYLRDWLTTFLSSLTLDEANGGKNKERIKNLVCDEFNRRLFPDSKPLIKQILLKEFAIQ